MGNCQHYQYSRLPLTHQPGGPCTKSMEVSESHMEWVKTILVIIHDVESWKLWEKKRRSFFIFFFFMFEILLCRPHNCKIDLLVTCTCTCIFPVVSIYPLHVCPIYFVKNCSTRFSRDGIMGRYDWSIRSRENEVPQMVPWNLMQKLCGRNWPLGISNTFNYSNWYSDGALGPCMAIEQPMPSLISEERVIMESWS